MLRGSSDGISYLTWVVQREDIVLHRCGYKNTDSDEVMDTISVGRRSYFPPWCVLALPHGCDRWYPEEILGKRMNEQRGIKLLLPRFICWISSCARMSLVVFCDHVWNSTTVYSRSVFFSERRKVPYPTKFEGILWASKYSRSRKSVGDSTRIEDKVNMIPTAKLLIIASKYVGERQHKRKEMHDMISGSNKIKHSEFIGFNVQYKLARN